MRNSKVLFIGFLVLLLNACASTDNSALTSSGYACTVSSVSVSGTSSLQFSITATGGTANYQITSVTAAGITGSLSSGSASFASTNSPIYLFSSLTATTLAAAMGTVTISDSSSTAQSTSCTYSVAATTTTTASGLACLLTPSTTAPTLNSTATFTMTGSGGTLPYTFSNFTPGANGYQSTAITQQSTSVSSATAYYYTTGTSTPSVTVTDGAGASTTCSTSVVVGSNSSTGSTSLICNAVLNPNPSYRGQQVSAQANITAYGNGNVRVLSIQYPTASGMTGYFTGPTSALVTFPIPGSWLVTFVIGDSAGYTSTCQAYQQVN